MIAPGPPVVAGISTGRSLGASFPIHSFDGKPAIFLVFYSNYDTFSIKDWNLDGGHRNRILLALLSGLPNEIDWAFNKLIPLSHICPDNFSIKVIPGVLDAIMEHARPFISCQQELARKSQMAQLKETAPLATIETAELSANDNMDSIGSSSSSKQTSKKISGGSGDWKYYRECQAIFGGPPLPAEQLERTLQIFHIIRNLSFVEPNLPVFIQHSQVMKMLELALAGRTALSLNEIRRYALDTVENMSGHLVMQTLDNPLLLRLKQLLHDQDRAMIVGALRCLTRLYSSEANEAITFNVEPSFMERLVQLLFVWDEEVIGGVLELLYHYSNILDSVAGKIAEALRLNLVHVLMKFLEWRAANRPAPAPVHSQHQQQSSIVASQQVVNQQEIQQAQERCLQWWQSICQPDPNGSILHEDAYKKYIYHIHDRFKGRPLVANDFIRCGMAVHTSLRLIPGPKGPHIHGVRYALPSEMPPQPLLPSHQQQQSNGASVNPQTVQRGPISIHPLPPISYPHQSSVSQSSIPYLAALVMRNLSRAAEAKPLFVAYERELLLYSCSPYLHETVGKVLASILAELSRASNSEE